MNTGGLQDKLKELKVDSEVFHSHPPSTRKKNKRQLFKLQWSEDEGTKPFESEEMALWMKSLNSEKGEGQGWDAAGCWAKSAEWPGSGAGGAGQEKLLEGKTKAKLKTKTKRTK